MAACSPPPAAPPAYKGEAASLIGKAWTGEGLSWLDAAPSGRATVVRWWTEG